MLRGGNLPVKSIVGPQWMVPYVEFWLIHLVSLLTFIKTMYCARISSLLINTGYSQFAVGCPIQWYAVAAMLKIDVNFMMMCSRNQIDPNKQCGRPHLSCKIDFNPIFRQWCDCIANWCNCKVALWYVIFWGQRFYKTMSRLFQLEGDITFSTQVYKMYIFLSSSMKVYTIIVWIYEICFHFHSIIKNCTF